MQSYIIRRILLLIPTLFIVTVIIFFLVRFVPGSAVDVIEAQLAQGGSVEIDRAAIEHMLGLDVAVHVQYGRWMSNIFLHGDFGNSIIHNRPALQMVFERMPVTFELGVLAILIGLVISLPLGIYSAVRQDTLIDYTGRSIAILMISVPTFWIGTLVMIYPSVWWGWSPPVELIPFTKDPLGNLGMFIIPAFIMGTHTSGGSMRLVRTMMLEVMRQDYIRTAWAKGLNERAVIIRHALKNALIPVVTMIGAQLGILIGGAIIIEQIFCLPGMGMLMIHALNERDYPVISALTLLTSIFIMVMNLLVDLTYAWLDPRIHYK